MTDNYGVPSDLLEELANAEKLRQSIERKISETACRNAGVKEGEIMRNKFSGLFYQIKGFHAYVNNINGQVTISVQAHRYWQTGRKAGKTAYSTSFLYFSDLEKVDMG